MSEGPRILAFAGSARDGSFNKRLVRIAARGAEKAGAATTVADLRDHPMPVYDADLEQAEGLPSGAATFKELLASHEGLLIASPENNGSISALLKNTIDWATRSPDAQVDLSGFRGRVVALMAASPGPLGGLRGLVHVRAILGGIGCIVLPDQLTIRSAGSAFDAEGELTDERQASRVEGLGARLAEVVRKLA